MTRRVALSLGLGVSLLLIGTGHALAEAPEITITGTWVGTNGFTNFTIVINEQKGHSFSGVLAVCFPLPCTPSSFTFEVDGFFVKRNFFVLDTVESTAGSCAPGTSSLTGTVVDNIMTLTGGGRLSDCTPFIFSATLEKQP